MEKKTIGKFISALRKASGMTQKELGEKLFVSDKTVSRWECDECAPELSLIPSIAEIFAITTDELLRGERDYPRSKAAEGEEGKQKAKSEKQFKLLLAGKARRYKYQSVISVGITLLGLLAAMVLNLGFSQALIAFCVGAAFSAVSEICQICFAIQAVTAMDADDALYAEKIQKNNVQAVKAAVAVSFFNVASFSFCLPLAIFPGRISTAPFLSWLGDGLLLAVLVFMACYVIYALCIRGVLCKWQVLPLSEGEAAAQKRENKILRKILSRALLVAVIFGILIGIWYIIGWQAFLREKTFSTTADFKASMESDYNQWFKQTFGTVLVNGEEVDLLPGDPGYPHTAVQGKLIYRSIQNFSGETICEYYYNPDLYWQITFTPSADDRMPVTVITAEAVETARSIFQTVETALYLLILLDFLAAAGIYLIKRKNPAQADENR